MQTPDRDRLEIIDDAVVRVGDDGLIMSVGIEPGAPVDLDLGTSGILMPGLVDTHIHAPQWPQVGTGLDLPLEDWLFQYTLPLEARYSDHRWAAEVWDDLVPSLLASGTTTAVYYSSIDLQASSLLARACADHGQRAFVGRVAMDHPEGAPEWYRDAGAADSVRLSHESITQIQAIGSSLVRPLITPRFAPSCTDAALEGLAELATATGVRIQTHCSESDWEHGYAFDRFGVSDTVALERFGLVRSGTVLAHCGHVDDDDLTIMSRRGAGVAHCPLSNAYFGDAVFPAKRALNAGVTVGLGSDLAGGFGTDLLGQCGAAVTSSRMLMSGVDPATARANRGVADSSIDAVTAFWMATRGGATMLDIPVGLLEPGRSFDAIVVDVNPATRRLDSSLRWWPEVDSPERLFEKIVRTAASTDIERVWVAGRQVKGTLTD